MLALVAREFPYLHEGLKLFLQRSRGGFAVCQYRSEVVETHSLSHWKLMHHSQCCTQTKRRFPLCCSIFCVSSSNIHSGPVHGHHAMLLCHGIADGGCHRSWCFYWNLFVQEASGAYRQGTAVCFRVLSAGSLLSCCEPLYRHKDAPPPFR